MPRVQKVQRKTKRRPPSRTPKKDDVPSEQSPQPSRSSFTATSTSNEKLSKSLGEYDEYTHEFKYDIVDLQEYTNFLSTFMSCTHCGGKFTMTHESTIGLARLVKLDCSGCDQSHRYWTSKYLQVPNNPNSHAREINIRFIYAMRSIGQGEASSHTFCAVMNLPPPAISFNPHDHLLGDACKVVCKETMKEATLEAVEKNDNNRDIPVAFDGSWQKRGFSSLNGIVSASSVDTRKILDVAIFTKFCKCKGRLRDKHDEGCKANFQGSSGGMAVAGVKELFENSKEANVRYTKYLGDGDSKAFKIVFDSQPYGPDVPIEKLECVGHVQKRMGTRLRALKNKSGKLTDGKPLGGKNRLTANAIDKLQTFYGLAIRRNVDNLKEMRRAIWATYFHVGSSDDWPRHDLCPKGNDSWCKYNQAMEKNELYSHKEHFHLHPTLMIHIKPINEDLSHPDLLKRCLHGQTQNSCESVNNVIWSRLPKRVFVQIGFHMVDTLRKIDLKRIREANDAAREMTKEARRARSNAMKRLEDKFEETEGKAEPLYASGAY